MMVNYASHNLYLSKIYRIVIVHLVLCTCGETLVVKFQALPFFFRFPMCTLKIYGSSPSPLMYLSKMLSTFMQVQLQNLYNIIIVKEKLSLATTCNWLLFVIVLKFSCNYIFAKSCFWSLLIVYVTSLQLMVRIFYHMDDSLIFFIQIIPKNHLITF